MDVLALVEPLTHVERVRRLVALGRRAAEGDAEAQAELSALASAKDGWARSLALTSAWGSRDAALVLACLTNASRSVRTGAAHLLPLLADDAAVVEGLGRIREPRLLVQMLIELVRRGRKDCVDTFLDRGGDADPRLIDLLPLGSPSLVTRHLPLLRERGGPAAWTRLAERHPAVTADELQARLDESSGTIDPRLSWRLYPLLPRLARRDPARTLELVRRLLVRGHSPAMHAMVLRELVRSAPTETFDMLRALQESAAPVHPPGPFSVIRLDRVAHRLGKQRLEWLVRHAWGALSDGDRGRRWLLKLTPDDRDAFIKAWLKEGRGAWGGFILRHIAPDGPHAQEREQAYCRWSEASRNHDGVIVPDRIDALPADLRIREARRHLTEVSSLASRPAERLEYARLLPFSDAKTVMQPWLGHPEGEERARAGRTLMLTARHDRGALGEALAYAHARKFEQDPVRMALVDGLANLPVACFKPADLPAVGLVVEDALDAADLSPGTSSYIERLVVRLFRVDAPWGAEWLTRLLAVRGELTAPGLGSDLKPGEVRALAPVLAELAQKWSTHERLGSLVWLAMSLEKRLPLVDALCEALQRIAREVPLAGYATMAVRLLYRHARPRFSKLVPELIAADKTFIISSEIRDFLSCRRQDLLGPFLDDQPMEGRFATGNTNWVIAFSRGLGSWTASQQRKWAAALARLIDDQQRDVPALRHAITSLARLAFASPAALLGHAADRRQPVREMVIRALPWLDGGEGLVTLIEALGDDRARWAIYALRKAFRELTQSQILDHLAQAPMTKVTVAKEVLRLLGEMRDERAYLRLLELDQRELHRDVRVALLRALWDHLEREPTWEVLERAVAHPDWIIAAKLAEMPLERLSTTSQARVARLLASVLDRPEPEARLDLLSRLTYLPLSDGERVLWRRCLDLVVTHDVDQCARACSALLSRMLPSEAAEASARLQSLIPRRKILSSLIEVLASMSGPYRGAHVGEVARTFCAALGRDPLAATRFVDLAGRVYQWKALAEALIDLSQRGLLHADAMSEAMRALGKSTHPELIEQSLADAEDPCLRRLALEALQQAAGPGRGWSRDRRRRLEKYRADSSPLVAGAAAFVFPPDGSADTQ